MERKALGKGINALIQEKESDASSKVVYVQTAQIKPNPFQPRENFDNQSMEELIQSIKEKGVIQPILVRRKSDYYELIAGERRFRAANSLGINELPVIIKDVEDQGSLEISLIENIQRQNLNHIEEARAYQYLIAKFGLTQERLSEIVGKSRVSVANILRLLKLPQEIQEYIKNGTISFAHGRALLELEDLNQQRFLAQAIISNKLSVRELENLIKRQRVTNKRKVARQITTTETFVAVLQEELQHIFATKVRIIKRNKRGHIIIEFYSQEDLNRIIEKIRGGSIA